MTEAPTIEPPPAPYGLKRRHKRWWIVFGSVILILIALDEVFRGIVLGLLLGWFYYLRDTFPQTQVEPVMIASGLVALCLATLTFHRFASWIASQRYIAPQPWRWRSTFAITALVLILFSTAICCIGIAHQMAWLTHTRWSYMQWIEKGRDSRNSIALSRAIREWAFDHDEMYLDRLEQVKLRSPFPRSDVLMGRGTNITPEPWIYLASGRIADTPAWAPILASPRPHQRHHIRSVVLADWSLIEMDEVLYQELIQQWNAYRSGPASVAPPDAPNKRSESLPPPPEHQKPTSQDQQQRPAGLGNDDQDA